MFELVSQVLVSQQALVSTMAEVGEQRWFNTEVTVLPGDRDGCKHYVTGDNMIFIMERER